MESFGEILKIAREKRELDLEKVSHDTSISIEYIRALEMEQTDVFPGEPYLVGFLRNYAEYLNLDAKYLIQLYRSKKIQEAPIPPGLLRDEKTFPWKIVLPLGIALSILVGLGLFFFIRHINNDSGVELLEKTDEVQIFTLTSVPIQKRVYENDIISVMLASGQVELLVEKQRSNLCLVHQTASSKCKLVKRLNFTKIMFKVQIFSTFFKTIQKTTQVVVQKFVCLLYLKLKRENNPFPLMAFHLSQRLIKTSHSRLFLMVHVPIHLLSTSHSVVLVSSVRKQIIKT